MKLVTSAVIIDFVDKILENDELKRLFTDVWIDWKSIQSLYKYVSERDMKISSITLKKRFKFIAESKSFGLHMKDVLNKTIKVSNKFLNFINLYQLNSTL